jgi:hypothetical protein
MADPIVSTANSASLAAEALPTRNLNSGERADNFQNGDSVPPSEESKSRPTRYVLGVNRVLIEGNGSKWAGEKDDPLGMLLDRLERYALDPRFEDYGGFASMAHFSFEVREYTDDGGYTSHEVDLGPMYVDAPYAVVSVRSRPS